MKGEISRNETNAATLAVSHAIPLLVCVVVYAVIAVLSVMMCSCGGQTNSKLKEAVAMANSMCPIDYGNGSKLESIKYDESRNEATMTLSVDNGIVDIATLKSNEANVKKLLCASFSQGCGNQWMIELANAGASFKVVFNEMSGKTVEILFTPEEVKKIAKGNVPTADMNQDLDSWVATKNQACPWVVGGTLSVTQVVREGDNVVMYIHAEEKEGFDFLRSQAKFVDEAKFGLLLELVDEDDIKLFENKGVSLIFRFFADDPTDCVEVIITGEELRNELNHQKQK